MAIELPNREELMRTRARQNGPSLLPPGLLDPIWHEVDDIWHTLQKMIDQLNELMGLADRVGDLENTVADLEPRVSALEVLAGGNRKAIESIVDHVYGGGEILESGTIEWGDSGKIPSGNINVYSQSDDPNSTEDRYIKCRDAVTTHDVWVM